MSSKAVRYEPALELYRGSDGNDMGQNDFSFSDLREEIDFQSNFLHRIILNTDRETRNTCRYRNLGYKWK